MKLYPYYIFLAVAVCVTLFFACTPKLDIPIDPDDFVEQAVCPDLGGWCDDKAGGCYRPECGQCHRTDLWVEFCPYVSSSSERSSSSVGGSSSSLDSGSSSSLGGGSSSDGSSSSGDSSSSSSVAISSSSSAIPPTLSDCKLPSTYVYKGEKVEGLVQIENNNGSCTGITYSPANYPSSASNTPQTFSTKATATCGSVSLSKDCSWTNTNGIIVANDSATFVKKDTHYKVNKGTTVIIMPITDPLQNRLGCEYSSGGTDNIVFTLTINGVKVTQNGNQNWWVNSFKFDPTYITNGNRILFETQNSGLECATTHE